MLVIINHDLIDESPKDYKNLNEIISQLTLLFDFNSIEIYQPVYSFKSYNQLSYIKNRKQIAKANFAHGHQKQTNLK